MRRKIAFGLTVGMTVLLAVLQPEVVPAFASLSLFGLNAHTLSIVLVGVTLVAVGALCFTRKAPLVSPHGSWFSVCGWMSTFCGAVLTMTVVLDLFFLAIYGEMPAPGVPPTSGFDYILLICVMLFGLAGGLYLVLQGFRWMSSRTDAPAWLHWMALCPVLWMWFRLARYEISYASTLDIDESFFTFATMVFASLFFLQFARAVTHVGKPPKNSLLILALMTGLVTLSAAPAAIVKQSVGAPISSMMIVIVDAVIGLTAFFYAAMQVFTPYKTEEQTPPPAKPQGDSTDDLSWEQPTDEVSPVDPPFSMDEKLPFLNAATVEPARYPRRSEAIEQDVPAVTADPAPSQEAPPVAAPTVDELLSEIDDF